MTFRSFLPGLLLAIAAFFSMVQPAAAQTPDPGLMGTHTVLKAEYNLGDAAYAPPAAAMFPINMEVRGSVHYPADLSSGPFPVLFWLHGRHSTCYNPFSLSDYSSWPCNPGDSPIVSYEGYDYVAKTMASHGYIVISISANAINATDGGLPDAGMNARGVLVQHHMDLWHAWSTTDTTGPFHRTFIGKLNMQNVGTMGHSRGGEGVVFNAEYNRSLGSPYGIKAIFTLAPVDFYRHYVNGIAQMDLAPYCDGDVSDLEGVHFYDDPRYTDTTDQMPKHTLLFMGANHDFFNTVWTPGSYVAGGADDWADYGYSAFDPHCGTSMPSRFDTTKQKAGLNAYMPAFFRLYMGNETQFAPILEVNDLVPPVSSTLDSSNVFVSYHPGYVDRRTINQTTAASNLTINTLGGTVTSTGFVSTAICGGSPFPSCDPGLGGDQKPHQGMGQMRMRWNDTTSWYDNAIPAAYKDATNYENLLFRAVVDFAETTPGSGLNFTVELVDSLGDSSSQVVGSLTHALFYPPGTESFTLPKEVFNTINVPMSGFTGINKAKIKSVRFKLNKSAAGSILITDLAFTNPICGNFTAAYTDSITHIGHKVLFTNRSTSVVATDTLKYLWNFGDPTTGTADTSTQTNPFHIFSHVGTYTVCLTVYNHRQNKLVCTDSTCTTVTVPHGLDVPTVAAPNITIIPNPAKDYIQINGAAKTDVLKLYNVFGQEVFTSAISQPVIPLPAWLASGMYYAIVVTPAGNAYQKVVISR